MTLWQSNVWKPPWMGKIAMNFRKQHYKAMLQKDKQKKTLYFKAIDNPFSWQVSCSNLQPKVP